jgi:hypothetical protein
VNDTVLQKIINEKKDGKSRKCSQEFYFTGAKKIASRQNCRIFAAFVKGQLYCPVPENRMSRY